jgi:hypothetical protein
MTSFADPDDPDTIRSPFIFVPHGEPLPTDWLRDHPDWLRAPATMVRKEGTDGTGVAVLSLDENHPSE